MKIIINIAKKIKKYGGRCLIIGGWVRDFVMGLPPKDVDIEVYGLKQNVLEKILSEFGKVNLVGKEFGVYKIGELDISLPRRENKIKEGHKGFAIDCDPFMSLEEAVLRRDLTINSLFYDPLSKEIIDPVGGINDIKNRTLRYNSREKFREDPLRVYRVFQFAGRFEFQPTPELEKLMLEMVKSNELDHLPKERIMEEITKLLLKAKKPSLGFNLALKVGVIEKYYPELFKMVKTEQNPEWHGEGSVWNHTMLVIDHGSELKAQADCPLAFMLGCLCHDMGKPLSTKIDNGVIKSHGHAEAGVEPTSEFLNKITNETDLIKKVSFLVKNHMRPLALYDAHLLGDEPRDSAFRRLAMEAEKNKCQLEDLILLAHVDGEGSKSLNKKKNEELLPWFKERISKIKEQGDIVPKPLVTGYDIMNIFGMKEGPELGKIHKKAYEFQIENNINDKNEIIEFIKDKI